NLQILKICERDCVTRRDVTQNNRPLVNFRQSAVRSLNPELLIFDIGRSCLLWKPELQHRAIGTKEADLSEQIRREWQQICCGRKRPFVGIALAACRRTTVKPPLAAIRPNSRNPRGENYYNNKNRRRSSKKHADRLVDFRSAGNDKKKGD